MCLCYTLSIVHVVVYTYNILRAPFGKLFPKSGIDGSF